MLPDIRAVIAAMLAAVGLLMVSFALVATFASRRSITPARCRRISPSAGGARRPMLPSNAP